MKYNYLMHELVFLLKFNAHTHTYPPPPGFKEDKMADALYKFFGPNTIYEDARKQTARPKQGPWTNHNLNIFLTNRENGDKPEADAGSKGNLK